MPETPAACKTRIRDAVAAAAEKGLDHAVTEIEGALVTAWLLERKGKLAPRAIPSFIQSVETALKKLAPPPPKKIKFDAPLRKILPLAEEKVKPALDAAMLLVALDQAGDSTEVSEKKRIAHEFFLDDWRRMTWESARIADWAKYWRLATAEERELEGKLSRDGMLRILEAIHNRRKDNLTPIPSVSVVACQACGGFDGRDRVRCAKCNRTLCTKCLSPETDVCLDDYRARYAELDGDLRRRCAKSARGLLKSMRIDTHDRNETFARAFRERGIDVTFVDSAPLDGEESEAHHGRWRLEMRDCEGTSSKRILFGALARSWIREVEMAAEQKLQDFFVDVCLGVAVEEKEEPPPPAPAEPAESTPVPEETAPSAE